MTGQTYFMYSNALGKKSQSTGPDCINYSISKKKGQNCTMLLQNCIAEGLKWYSCSSSLTFHSIFLSPEEVALLSYFCLLKFWRNWWKIWSNYWKICYKELFWEKSEEIWEEFWQNNKWCENYRNSWKAVRNNSTKI